MAITTKLELRQTHSLVMTPQLQQAIKLLQLSNMELASFVETELERNPLLERAEPDETGSPGGRACHRPGRDLHQGGGRGRAPRPIRRGPVRRRRGRGGEGDDGEWVDLEASARPDRGSRCRAARRLSRCRRLFPRCAQGLRLEHARPRLARRARRGLQSRGLCGRGEDAQGSSYRSARACLRRSAAPLDRASSHRHD